ncbi:MAG: hypothetical protein V7L22_06905 [Nostoc sp.]|uniref:hypothetical protein n=1 Tax=Nostoc sp. TaxID=1180 RepID=UPI002FFBB261
MVPTKQASSLILPTTAMYLTLVFQKRFALHKTEKAASAIAWNTTLLTFDFRLAVLGTPVIAFYFYKALLSE